MLYEEHYFDVNTYMVEEDCCEDDELVTITEEDEEDSRFGHLDQEETPSQHSG